MTHQMKIYGRSLDRGIQDVIRAINAKKGLHTTSSCSGMHPKNVGAHVIIRFDTKIKSTGYWLTKLQSTYHLRRNYPPSRLKSNYITYTITPINMNPKEFWNSLRHLFSSKQTDNIKIRYAKRFLK